LDILSLDYFCFLLFAVVLVLVGWDLGLLGLGLGLGVLPGM
jgi:hypothetical protein